MPKIKTQKLEPADVFLHEKASQEVISARLAVLVEVKGKTIELPYDSMLEVLRSE